MLKPTKATSVNCVWITKELWRDRRLNWTEKAILEESVGLTDSRADYILASLTRGGYIIRVSFNGRVTQRVVAPKYSVDLERARTVGRLDPPDERRR
jgi:hypothetical protein